MALSPALIANYIFELAKDYNHFYQVVPVLKAEKEADVIFRLHLSAFIGNTIKNAMALLGIDVPERM
ncbi:MAG: DALR anticodon-binding domain-containing protein [Bacteroidetes bacterium]|nr:DALR anticodon-binding domain-containing protein [Bacteroidota bacterium]